jgi:hypothetical protein
MNPKTKTAGKVLRRVPVPDMQRWPINSTRFLFPCVAIKGFKSGPMRIILSFWRWRADFEIQLQRNPDEVMEVGK